MPDGEGSGPRLHEGATGPIGPPQLEGDVGPEDSTGRPRRNSKNQPVTDVVNSMIRVISRRPTDASGSKAVTSTGSKKKYGNKKRNRLMTSQLFKEVVSKPAIGGCVDIQESHSEYLLHPEVVLFEPSLEEIFSSGVAEFGQRNIFLNMPLLEEEVEGLQELHDGLREETAVTSAGDGEIPEYVRLHALRMLQFKKWSVPRTIDLIGVHLTERVQRLPIAEKDVRNDLGSCFMYWHGRDRKCRPCLVIRIACMGECAADKERAVRLVIFVLEYAIRYAMVPGRVENWVVVLDLDNASSVVSWTKLGSLVGTAKGIATALESVYCGRMVWMKIINMPGMLRSVVEGCIPAEKKKKVMFPGNAKEDLPKSFEPNQLEARYGGTAPDVEPGHCYPYRFFPGATGCASAEKYGSDKSMHGFSDRHFHEGELWDHSEDRQHWMEKAQASALTPSSAQAVSKLVDTPIKPVSDIDGWLRVINPEEMARREGRPMTNGDSVKTVDTVQNGASENPEAEKPADAGQGPTKSEEDGKLVKPVLSL